MKITMILRLIGFFLIIQLFPCCSKLLDIDPPKQSISAETIYSNNSTAASVLTGIYAEWGSFGLFTGKESISLRTGLYGDELVSNASETDILTILYRNKLMKEGRSLFWKSLYAYIYKANSAIEGINNSNSLSEDVKKQLIGEALFVRALLYFYLVNLYGDVPLILTTDLTENIVAERAPTVSVYTRIISDLNTAMNFLKEDYVSSDATTPTYERVRPSKFAAIALLARVYLYTRQWKNAEVEATKLIQNSKFKLETHQNVFLKSSSEAIWQIQPTIVDRNTQDAVMYSLKQGNVIGPNTGSRPAYISSTLYNSFEEGDLRKSQWIDTVTIGAKVYPFPTKYKIWQVGSEKIEYIMMLRLSEQYLIRAEARLMQGDIENCYQDIKTIRARSGLESINYYDKDSLQMQIILERRHELFTEGGHRWLDLKRSNLVERTMDTLSLSKGGTWASYKALFPLPTEDIRNNPKLQGHQNPGYPEF